MQDIKQLIKYPVKYDKLNYFFDADNNMIAEIRGFGRIDNKIGIVAQFIEDAINEKLSGKISLAVEQTEKAFGGCKNCYGKGYSTTKIQARRRRDVWELNPINPCDCQRGKDISNLINNK